MKLIDRRGAAISSRTARTSALDRHESERQTAEQQLHAYAAEVTDLYDNSPCGYHSLDGQGVCVRVNATELAWLGHTHDEVIGRLRFIDILTNESRQHFLEQFAKFKATGRIENLEFEIARKDGSTFHVSLSATAVYDPQGQYRFSRSTLVRSPSRPFADCNR